MIGILVSCLLVLVAVLGQEQQHPPPQQHQQYQHQFQRTHMHQSGYHCTEDEINFQFEYNDLVNPSICDSPTVWRLAQLAMPDASVFLDIGGNRGYTAAKIFGLWTPGHGLTRRTLKQSILRDVELKLVNDNNIDTVCADGETEDHAIYCAGGTEMHPNTLCQHRRSIQVYSFDGQILHVNNTRHTIYKQFPELDPNVSSTKGLKALGNIHMLPL